MDRFHQPVRALPSPEDRQAQVGHGLGLASDAQSQIQLSLGLGELLAQDADLARLDPILDRIRHLGEVTVNDPLQIRPIIGHFIDSGSHQKGRWTEECQRPRPVTAR